MVVSIIKKRTISQCERYYRSIVSITGNEFYVKNSDKAESLQLDVRHIYSLAYTWRSVETPGFSSTSKAFFASPC